MSLAIVLICDALMGEPRWLWSRVPHPAVLMGKLVSLGDARLNQGALRRLKGVLFVAALVALMWALGSVLARGGALIECLLASVLMAQRSLVEHVRAVADGLRMSLAEGRFAVSMIVGRDTAQMDEAQAARAAIESAAENFSDGVVAPAFWFAVFGLPGILVYKAVNTADSMIGHRTERHEAYGWAAARLDDLLNLVPARLAALLIAVWGGQLGNWSEITREARRHRSPNAGWPEAAMARSLGVAVSGPRSYAGQLSKEPFVNETGRRDAKASDIDAACHFLWRAWAGLLGVALLLGAVGMIG